MSLFTKTGFSRSFSCCNHFVQCDLGKGQCYYFEEDPEVQHGCHAWTRNHKKFPKLSFENMVEEVISKPVVEAESKTIEETESETFDVIQMSLF